MPDDRTPPSRRRPRIYMSAAERERIDRDRSPEFIDPDDTPPPRPLPDLEIDPDFDSIPPPIGRQLRMLHRGQSELVDAIGKGWESRHAVDLHRRLEDKVDLLNIAVVRNDTVQQKHLLPFVREQPARLTALTDEMHKVGANVARMGDSLELIAQQIRERVDENRTRITSTEVVVSGHAAALSSLDRQGYPARIGALEKRNADLDAGDRREAAIVVRRRRILGGIWAALSAAGGAIAGWFTSR